MSRSSEDILLQVKHVKHKKNEGTLYLMGERMAWMASHKSDSFGVNHRYIDVKSQKISPEGKPKIQLQIVLHDGSCTTFHFVDPVGGRDGQIKQRDDVKELLQQLLPKFKRKINKELEEKNRLLSDNPGLLQLYKDLVITGILNADEFWSQHAPQTSTTVSSNSKAENGAGSSNGLIKKSALGLAPRPTPKQEVGVTGSFLGEIKPQADGANGVRYNLTADIIESIFKTYPAVKRKHLENVPTNISEQEFWTKFFQSHYFHRDRLHGKGFKDIFTECAKDDDKAMKEQIKAGLADPVANISEMSDKTIDESYGATDGSATNSNNVVHASIIKRFNQHSIMVMRAGKPVPAPTPGPVQEEAASDKKSSEKEKSNKPTFVIKSGDSTELKSKKDKKKDKDKEKQPPTTLAPLEDPKVTEAKLEAKRKRLHEKTGYEDLEDEPAKKIAALNLAKTDRYLLGPTPSTSTSAASLSDIRTDLNLSTSELNQWRSATAQAVGLWKRGHTLGGGVLSAKSAVSVLNELSPGGALMKSSRQEQIAEQMYPSSVITELKQLYVALSELLRHFWACFFPKPPTSSAMIEKANKMHETLRKFHLVKLTPFENELMRSYSSAPNITVHLNQMLEAAYRKYATWQQNASRMMPQPR